MNIYYREGARSEFSASEQEELLAFSRTTAGCGEAFTGDRYAVAYDSKHHTIQFMFSFFQTEDFVEIYDVCTTEAQRRKGLASTVLSTFLQKHAGHATIWTGIRDANLIPFYWKLGFRTPTLANTTPLGHTFPFFFVSLLYTTEARAKRVAKDLLQLSFTFETPKVETLYLRYTDYIRLQAFVERGKYEVGGILGLDGRGQLRIGPLKRGSETEWAVDPGCSDMVFHTHPVRAYSHYDYGLGLPSLPDYLFSISCPVRLHLIFALEGIFSVELSQAFIAFETFLAAYDQSLFAHIRKALTEKLADETHRQLSWLKDLRIKTDVLMTEPDATVKQLYQESEFRERIERVIHAVLDYINRLTWQDLLPRGIILPFAYNIPVRVFYAEYIPTRKVQTMRRRIPLHLHVS